MELLLVRARVLYASVSVAFAHRYHDLPGDNPEYQLNLPVVQQRQMQPGTVTGLRGSSGVFAHGLPSLISLSLCSREEGFVIWVRCLWTVSLCLLESSNLGFVEDPKQVRSVPLGPESE